MIYRTVAEDLQDKVQHNRIANIKDLERECAKYGLDPYDDILSEIEFNSCERCGDLYPSEQLIWLDYAEPSADLLKGVAKEKVDYCAICDDCAKQLIELGKER